MYANEPNRTPPYPPIRKDRTMKITSIEEDRFDDQAPRVLEFMFKNGYVNITHQLELEITRLSAVILQIKNLGVEIRSETIAVKSKYKTSWISNYYLG